MVYRGKPSKGCARCRQKKMRCDEVAPECTRCVRSHQPCPGYRSQLDLMFCDESSSVVRKARQRTTPSVQTTSSSSSRDDDTEISSGTFSPGSSVIDQTSLYQVDSRSSFTTDSDSMVSYEGSINSYADSMSVSNLSGCNTPLEPPSLSCLIQVPTTEAYDPIESIWLAMVISNPSILRNATSDHNSQLESQGLPNSGTSVLCYQQDVMHFLNEPPLQNTEEVICQETIITVLGLAVQAIVEQNTESARIHVQGLWKMVTHAGGLQSISLHPAVQEGIFWTDICHAYTCGSEPRFTMPSTTRLQSTIPQLAIILLPNNDIASLGSGFTDLSSSSQTFNEVLEMFYSLRYHCVILSLAKSRGRSTSDSKVISDMLDAIEQQLFCLSTTRSSRFFSSTLDICVLKACRFAAMIFVSVVLRQKDSASPLFDYLVDALKFVLEKSSPSMSMSSNGWGRLGGLLLWVQFMGGVASRGRIAYTRFVHGFRNSMRVLGINSREEAGLVLRKFLWVQGVCERQLEVFYVHVEGRIAVGL